MTLMLGPLLAHIIDVEPATKVERVVILLHGFGAPGDDLVDLGQRQKGTVWVFPEAPLDMGDGRAWWMIDWNERARYERAGDFASYQKLVPPGLHDAVSKVDAMLDAVANKWNVTASQMVLGGFSQGSMLALAVAARREKKPAALVLLSSGIVGTPEWEPKLKSLAGVPVFQSHGTSDAVLPFQYAEQLRDMLGKAGARVGWAPFSGGHTIPPHVAKDLLRFVSLAP